MSCFKAQARIIGSFFLLLAPATTLMSSMAHAEAEPPCFRQGEICKTPEELKEAGITGVRIRVQSLRRDESALTTSWSLFAYRNGAQGNGAAPLVLAFNLDGILPELVQGEDAVLAAQERLCAPLRAAGLDCSRDLLDGSWYTYALPNGKAPFTVTFVNTSTSALAAGGTLETKRWGCRIDDLENGVAFEAELACSGKYYTSLRLLYLTNNTYLSLSELRCAETGRRRAATFATNGLPACDASAAYEPTEWQPFMQPNVSFVQSNAVRVFVQGPGISLYRMGL